MKNKILVLISFLLLPFFVYAKDAIHFIPVSNSDAFLIESNGKYTLVDSSNPDKDDKSKCGTSCIQNDDRYNINAVIKYLKNNNINHLDIVIATHSHSDHIGGMVKLASSGLVNNNTKYYYKKYIGTNEDTNTNWDNKGYYDKAINAMKSKNVSLIEVNSNINFNFGNFNIKFFNTETDLGINEIGENSNSIGLLITKGKIKTFLAADIEIMDEMKIYDKVGKVDILKVGHHGASSSSSYTFINKLNPSMIYISHSTVNSYMYPIISFINSKGGKAYYSDASLSNKGIATIVTINDNNYEVTNGVTIARNDNYNAWKTSLKGWIQNNKRWFYINDNIEPVTSWQKLTWNGKTNWYYFNSNGKYMETGWQNLTWNDKKSWYYFDSSGAMVTGWQELTYANKKSWYYFNTDGSMLIGWQKLNWQGNDNWYYFDDNGVMLKGWQYLTYNGKKNYYYFDNSGAMVTGTKTIDGKNYTFASDGALTSGTPPTIKEEKTEAKIPTLSYDKTTEQTPAEKEKPVVPKEEKKEEPKQEEPKQEKPKQEEPKQQEQTIDETQDIIEDKKDNKTLNILLTIIEIIFGFIAIILIYKILSKKN